MQIKANGEAVAVTDNLTVTQLLAERDVELPDMVSVELNGTIVARDQFGATTIHEGDNVEFLYFMGGGALE